MLLFCGHGETEPSKARELPQEGALIYMSLSNWTMGTWTGEELEIENLIR